MLGAKKVSKKVSGCIYIILIIMYNSCMNEIITLPSGLRLAYQNIPYVHSVSLGVFVKIGSRNELDIDNGIAHFTEHVLFKGTEKRTAFDIVKEMDSLGANMNAFTSKELTGFYFQCIDDTVDECSEILSDLLLHSTFPAEEVEKERGVVLEEIDMVYDIPDDLSQELCSSAYWGDHPLGKSILGPRSNVERFTRDDVLSFVSSHYVADNIVVSVCGNISREKAVDVVLKYFNFPVRPFEKREFPLPQKHGGRVQASYKDIEQANLTIAFPSLSYAHPDLLGVSVLSCALGGGMSSILFQEVREKLGLVYSVYNYLSTYEDTGAQCIYLGTNPKNLQKAVTAVKKCIADFCRNGMDEECFHRAKQQVKGSLTLGWESSMSIMRTIGKSALFLDRPFDLEERLSLLARLDRKQVNAMIPQFFQTDEVGVGYVGKQTSFDLTEIYQ